ncbi:MAG TPA: hypothetical protein VJV79_22890 [Polyangiaceae bacterium]|nr:hypothetical protein [Polyangiaceae bacterium]
MNQSSVANDTESSELVRALDELAERAPTIDPTELAALWPELERRVLLRMRADRPFEGSLKAPQLQAEEQRLRNLAWEVGVSVDLHAVHLGAIRTLATLLRERSQRSGRRVSSYDSNAHPAR